MPPGPRTTERGKRGPTPAAMTPRYVHPASQHLATINQGVSPMDKMQIKPLNRPYRKTVKK